MDTIVIVTNLGRLKAYRVVETPTRGEKLDLVESMNFVNAHIPYSGRVTDSSGRFPMGGGPVGGGTSPQMSTYEAMTAGLENERRLMKEVSNHIEEILMREKPEQWYFAATSEIHQAIVDELSPDLRARLTRSVLLDLSKMHPTDMLRHFSRWSD